MISVTMNLSAQEYQNLLRLHQILEKAKTGISPKGLDEHRRLHDRTVSGVMISAMIAVANHVEDRAPLLEVANG